MHSIGSIDLEILIQHPKKRHKSADARACIPTTATENNVDGVAAGSFGLENFGGEVDVLKLDGEKTLVELNRKPGS